MKKRRKKPAKGITLDDKVWLKNSQEIKEFRENLLTDQNGVCAISKILIETGVLDHTHIDGIGEDGKVRGVLLSEVNMLEGKYLKLFNKLKLNEKYGIDFPELLINMGKYLQQDNSSKPYHYSYMTEKRKQISRMTRDNILGKLKDDFNIVVGKLPKNELIRLYIQAWVDKIEGEINCTKKK